MQVYLLRLHPGSFPSKHYSQVDKVSKCTFSRAGEMARWLKAHSALAEDPGFVLRTSYLAAHDCL